MEIITGKKEDLSRMIVLAYRQLENCENLVDKYALADYINHLHENLNQLNGTDTRLDTRRCFGSLKKQKKYYDYIDSLFDKLDENFVKYKKFHSEFIGEIVDINNESLEDLVGLPYSNDSSDISKEEFYEMFFDFLKEYSLEDRFDKFISNKRIFNRPLFLENGYFGSVLHNPLSRESSIMFCGFEYNINYLMTLAHEFGHTYDLGEIIGEDSGVRNLKYSYFSPYGEVISSMFEKLFYDYLFKKKYRIEQLNDQAIDHMFFNKERMLLMYILTLLSDDVIWEGPGDVSKDIILSSILPYFDDFDQVKFIVENSSFDTWKDQAYAYGDVLSTVLKERVKEEGLDNELMRRFMSERINLFNPDFIVNNGFTADQYKKIYVKDVNRLKK